jgi:hypothetical protein
MLVAVGVEAAHSFTAQELLEREAVLESALDAVARGWTVVIAPMARHVEVLLAAPSDDLHILDVRPALASLGVPGGEVVVRTDVEAARHVLRLAAGLDGAAGARAGEALFDALDRARRKRPLSPEFGALSDLLTALAGRLLAQVARPRPEGPGAAVEGLLATWPRARVLAAAR